MKKQVNIEFNGSFHPSQIESFKYDQLSGIYYLYFFDKSEDDKYVGRIRIRDDKFYIDDVTYRSSTDFKLLTNLDVSDIPPVIYDYQNLKKNKPTSTIVDEEMYSIDSNKKEYLEVESYSDLVEGPLYYYFEILKMEPDGNSFIYDCKIVCKSVEPKKMNLIARHKTEKSLEELIHDGDTYYLKFDTNNKLDVNFELEARVIRALLKLEGNNLNLSNEEITKAVRSMLHETDYKKAAENYKTYIKKI